MNVYDAAHNLAREVKNSKEHREYIQKRRVAFDNQSTKEMILDFRKKAMEVQVAQMRGQRISRDEINQVNKLEEVLMQHPVIKEFFIAEMKLSKVMNDIYKILGESIDIDLGLDK